MLAAVVALLCSAAVQAEGAYMGDEIGMMDADGSDDSPFNAGIRAGYTWNSGWGIEAELTGSMTDGDILDRDFSISTQAVYATYRTQGDIYFKGRLGYLNEEVDVEYFGDASDSGASVGVGVGFTLAENISFETEYTLIEEEVDYWSGSLVVRF
ncbi:porin family protein [Microbulbifer sp. 2205BS26-8]|uniref:porin family protein n=1 Tax=Microbulbifer sp. 2205BS26-8 TaxID=3064386 RepID=UPI00273DE694|nr:porin family protein [Microbulbifer sp. 2205BS26-8]MDP5208622.1 porin family protein [Microbulbifer sp. 2205BS26-8]